MKAKKQFITLRFPDYQQPNAYRVRSVPILQHVKLCDVEGFAAHRVYLTWDAKPIKNLFRVSHIETGAQIASSSTILNAMVEAEKVCKAKGGAKAIAKGVRKILKRLKSQTLIA